MQPILDTATPNIIKEPRMVLNPARGNRRERGRCPGYWGMVLGLSEGAIYVRRRPTGNDEVLRGSKGIEGPSKVIEGPRRMSEILEGCRRCARDPRDVRMG